MIIEYDVLTVIAALYTGRFVNQSVDMTFTRSSKNVTIL